MPANFLTDEQNQTYARYPNKLTEEQLSRYFHLDDKDKALIASCRRDYNKFGYALQLVTVRFLGTFLANPIDVPNDIKKYIAQQLNINKTSLSAYLDRKATRLSHTKEIKELFGYSDFEKCGFRLTRWLYTQAWFSNERPSILFERSVIWLIDQKVLLPGVSTLMVLISKVRDHVAKKLWTQLTALVSPQQKEKLENLLIIPDGKRYSKLDELKNGPINISSVGIFCLYL